MTIEERLEKVEKELAILKKSAAAAPKEIRATSFIVVDEKGKDRAVLNVSGDRAGLSILDENGKKRIGMGVTKEALGLTFYDENMKALAEFCMVDNEVRLLMTDKKTTGRVILMANKDAAGLVLRDGEDKPRALLSVNTEGHHMLALLDGNNQARVILRSDECESSLILSDEKAEPRAMLSVLEDGPGLLLLDANGKDRVSLNVAEDGAGLRLFDEDGETIWTTSLPAVQ